MKSRVLLRIVLAGFVVCILFLTTCLLCNVSIFNVPIFGPKMPSSHPYPLNTYGLIPVNHTKIHPDDPLRNELITEDLAWEYAWVGLQERGEYNKFIPLSEKTTFGLVEVIDNRGNKYIAWEFFFSQNEFPILQHDKKGGLVYVDAHDGSLS